MKKILSLLLVLVMAVSFSVMTFADETGESVVPVQGAATQGPNFVDEDDDEVCDNFSENGNRQRNFVDQDNDGVCDNIGQNGNRGQGFVDEDNDGVCDRSGQGKGMRRVRNK